MASGDKILATQISTNSSSWYQRLRAIQIKTPIEAHSNIKITQTTDPGIISGSQASATSINNFIDILNSLQSNVFLSYANWSSYKPSTVSKGTLISASNIQTKINNMLTSLEGVCANYKTYGQYGNTCTDYTKDTTNVNCSDNANYDDDSLQSNCQTNGNYSQCGDYTNYDDYVYDYQRPPNCSFYGDYSQDADNATFAFNNDYTDNEVNGDNTIDNVCNVNNDYSVDGDKSRDGHLANYSEDTKEGVNSIDVDDSYNNVNGDDILDGNNGNYPGWDFEGSDSCAVHYAEGNHGVCEDFVDCTQESQYSDDVIDGKNTTNTDCGQQIINSVKAIDTNYSNEGNDTVCNVDVYYSKDSEACNVNANYFVEDNNTNDATNSKYSDDWIKVIDNTDGYNTNYDNNNVDSVNSIDTNDNDHNKCVAHGVYANYTDDTENNRSCTTYVTYNVI